MRTTIESGLCFLLLAILLAFAWFGVCGRARADQSGCYDVITNLATREVISAQPVGHGWGENEGSTHFRHVGLCGLTPQVADFLSSPLLSPSGSLLSGHRYTMDATGAITDRQTGSIVTVDQVAAAQAAAITPLGGRP
jgi:hypothetical protein